MGKLDDLRQLTEGLIVMHIMPTHTAAKIKLVKLHHANLL